MAPEEMVEIDLDGKAVRVPRDVVRALAASAADRAGISERHRDLSLLLHRALESGRAPLKRAEVRALCAVLEERPDRFGSAGDELLQAVA
jgi:hypothetical protein